MERQTRRNVIFSALAAAAAAVLAPVNRLLGRTVTFTINPKWIGKPYTLDNIPVVPRPWSAIWPPDAGPVETTWKRFPMGDMMINGKPHRVKKGSYPYEALVAMAGLTGTPSVIWSIPGRNECGSLLPGQVLVIGNDTHLSVVHTNNA